MIGDGMVGRMRAGIRDTCSGAFTGRNRSQSPHSSDEAGNDRGAKGGRKVEANEKHHCRQNCRECRKAKQDREAGRNASFSKGVDRALVRSVRKNNTGGSSPPLASFGLISAASVQAPRAGLWTETTNWKAGCGKTARPVWREG